jgi:hypothetical protein
MKPCFLALTCIGLVCSTVVSGQGGDPHYGKTLERRGRLVKAHAEVRLAYDEGPVLAEADASMFIGEGEEANPWDSSSTGGMVIRQVTSEIQRAMRPS